MTRQYINPPGLFKHPNYTRVLTVEKPSKLIFIAGQTPADENYQPVHPGDVGAQYLAVLEGLTLELRAAGATWESRRKKAARTSTAERAARKGSGIASAPRGQPKTFSAFAQSRWARTEMRIRSSEKHESLDLRQRKSPTP